MTFWIVVSVFVAGGITVIVCFLMNALQSMACRASKDLAGIGPLTLPQLLFIPFVSPVEDLFGMLPRLPRGFVWTFWLLGASLSTLPVAVSLLEGQRIGEEQLVWSLVLAGILCGGWAVLAWASKVRSSWPAFLWTLLSLGALFVTSEGSYQRTRAQRMGAKVCGINNLKQIGLALRLYEDREGKFPPYDGDRFLAKLYLSGDVPDLKLFRPKGAPVPIEGEVRGLLPGCIPGMAAYRNATSCLTEWSNPSVCAIACDTMPDGKGPYGGGHVRIVLYQDGSVRSQTDLTIGSTNGDPGGPKDLSILQTN